MAWRPRRQAIIWTNAGILLIGPLGTNVNEIIIEIQTFSFKKMHFKMTSAKWRPSIYWRICDLYMWQCIGSSFVQAMDCHQTNDNFIVKWTFEIKNFSQIRNKIPNFPPTKMHLNMSLARYQPFCSGLDVLQRFMHLICCACLPSKQYDLPVTDTFQRCHLEDNGHNGVSPFMFM